MAHFPTIRSILDPGALASLLEDSYGVQMQRLQLLKPVVLDTYRVWTPGGLRPGRPGAQRRERAPGTWMTGQVAVDS